MHSRCGHLVTAPVKFSLECPSPTTSKHRRGVLASFASLLPPPPATSPGHGRKGGTESPRARKTETHILPLPLPGSVPWDNILNLSEPVPPKEGLPALCSQRHEGAAGKRPAGVPAGPPGLSLFVSRGLCGCQRQQVGPGPSLHFTLVLWGWPHLLYEPPLWHLQLLFKFLVTGSSLPINRWQRTLVSSL